ncbi:MAG TPA: S1 RNA-binding domain-containing protein, partial [Anaerolineae bacterium]|nr:S1 RNA-binding domain-containing protein [Anaerolineae bacterium]
DIVDGTIVSITPNEILVDVGAKSEGVVPSRELERLEPDFKAQLKEGDPVLVYVVRPEDKEGNILLSLSRAQQERDWRRAAELLEKQEIFEGLVTAANRGGVIVRLGKVRGFVPASQLVSGQGSSVPEDSAPDERWIELVGKTLQLKVIELDRERNRLILSERAAMRDLRQAQKERLLRDLKKGDVRKGVVTSLAKFGAFVDLGGADGLIHLSELSWGRVEHPSEVLKIGQEVEVYILNVDQERKRIGLSLRRLQPEPWSVVHEKYAVGQVVEGTITKITNFGAFACIDGTIEGLIHISELADHHINHPREVVKEGDTLQLRIIRIEPERRRMGLSLRQVPDEAYAEFDWREAAEIGEALDTSEGGMIMDSV